jgi:oligosaccharide translocation protein RFT1
MVSTQDANVSQTSSSGGATLLIGLQVGTRALTFIVNQLLLRYLSPDIFGISIQLEIYLISVLFFARESLRVATQRQNSKSGGSSHDGVRSVPEGHVNEETPAGKTQTIVNLAYIPIYLGCAFSTLLAWLYLKSVHGSVVQTTPYLRVALKIYGMAAICELLSEPCFVVIQHRSMYKIRAKTEAISTLARCLVTCAIAIWASHTDHDLGVLPFALGQAVYALTLTTVYYLSLRDVAAQHGFSLRIKPIFSKLVHSFIHVTHKADSSRDNSAFVLSYFSRPLLILGASIFVQSILKHILTQGDTILIATLATPAVQGTYALANNYGGLLARLILQPIEESSRNFFGRLLSTVDGKPAQSLVSKAEDNLTRLLRSYIIFSVAIVSVGPPIAPLLLKIVAGSRWTNSGAGDVLAAYCFYIPFLAVNGITEAFVSSVATESEVYRQSLWMLAFSAGFASAAYVFLGVLHLGARGLVWANVLNMTFRIIWSTSFIQTFLRRNGSGLKFTELLPSPLTLAVSVGTFSILHRLALASEGTLTDFMKMGLVLIVYVILL